MNVVSSDSIKVRRRPLAACLASLFALTPLPAIAQVTWNVNSCDGDATTGTGPNDATLRYAVANAASGDTVSLAGLSGANACPSSKISLTTGEILVTQASLIISGPGAATLTIDGSGNPGGGTGYSNSRIFTHSGNGTLTVENLTLSGGHSIHSVHPAVGGCIYSAANVTLRGALVTNCYTYNYGTYISRGGGVYTVGGLNLKYSVLADNNSNSLSTDAAGGGAFVKGAFTSKYSTVSGNTARLRAGGLYVSGNTTIATTTVSGNSAKSFAGIDAYSATSAGKTFQLGNSTISGNTASTSVGGLYVNSATVKFYNSTIAFNTAPSFAPGVEVNSAIGNIAVTLQSTLMSNNRYTLSDGDFVTVPSGNTITINGGNVATAANNLIRATVAPGLPNDTSHGCPLLGPLRDNGGLTLTHALGSTSPALENGNTNRSGGVPYDQRGPASANGTQNYPRVSGPLGDPTPKPDIGAFEVQQEQIFLAGFEGCSPLS